jgi:hypothetical protein
VHLQVAQELALATRDPILFCGYRWITWSSFTLAIRSIRCRILDQDLPSADFDGLYSFYENAETMARRRTVSWYDSECPRAVASAALRVNNLADIREAGPEAKFAEQFERTLFLQATDPRDHIFAILGISQSTSGFLKADYTSSKEQVAMEATAFIMQGDLAMYMRTRLWEYKHNVAGLTKSPFIDASQTTTPSWAPDLGVLGQRTLNDRFVPPSDEIQSVIEASNCVAPILQFSQDFKILYTAGYYMGRVFYNDIDMSVGRFKTDRGYQGRQPMRETLPDSTILV